VHKRTTAAAAVSAILSFPSLQKATWNVPYMDQNHNIGTPREAVSCAPQKPRFGSRQVTSAPPPKAAEIVAVQLFMAHDLAHIPPIRIPWESVS